MKLADSFKTKKTKTKTKEEEKKNNSSSKELSVYAIQRQGEPTRNLECH